jgi:glc operon protein GlcG
MRAAGKCDQSPSARKVATIWVDALVKFPTFHMKTKHYLTHEDVKMILGACEAHAVANKWAVCISIVDDGGHLQGFLRLDGAAPASVEISQGKAYSAAVRRRPTKGDEEMVNNGRVSALSMPGITFLEGGVPIVTHGETIGAVGVSGVKSSEDAEVAAAGIAALGL